MWVDALCINQNDAQEKNHQVQLMGRIFSQAEQVVVWLGRESSGSQSAMFRISSLYAEKKTSEDVLKDYEPKGFRHPEVGAMIALCSRSYWRRVWVIQEIYLSKRLEICTGNRSVSGAAFEYLYDICKALDRIGFISTLGHTPALHYHMAKKQDKQVDFYYRLCDAIEKDFNCSEPRDLVYTLLGASTDIREGTVLPDYNKPIEEVFQDTWMLLVARKGIVARAELFQKTSSADMLRALRKRFSELADVIETKKLSFAQCLAIRLCMDWENKQWIQETCKKIQQKFRPLEVLTKERAEGI